MTALDPISLQSKHSALALAPRPILDLKVHPMHPYPNDEERIFVLMELLYRTFGPRPEYGELCWQLVFGDTRPYPGELVAPSEWARIDEAHRQRVIQAGWRRQPGLH